MFDTNIVTTAGGTIITTSALTVSDYTLNTSTRIPTKFGRYTYHHPHFYHHQVSRRPSIPVDVLVGTTSGEDRLKSSDSGRDKRPLDNTSIGVVEPVVKGDSKKEDSGEMELMELRRSGGNNGNYVVGSINNNISRGNVTKISIEHRELPVDVPDSFVGVVKQAPRYPPPPPVTPSGTLTSTDSSIASSRTKVSTTGSNRSDATVTKIQSSSHHHAHPKMLSSSTPSSSMAQHPLVMDKGGHQQGKVKKTMDEMTRKRSEEEQFLRSSLRGSKKLQSLEAAQQQKQQKLPSPSRSFDVVDYGGINPAFQSDEHDYQNLGKLQEQNKG